jgi:hypothetical protein
VLGHQVVAAVVLDVFVAVAHGIALGHQLVMKVGTDTTRPVVAVGAYDVVSAAPGAYDDVSAAAGTYTKPVVAAGVI